MKAENRERRTLEIMDAAYAVLAEKGYRSTSMLAIARRAKASNETLYGWFGSKQKLFEAMVETNATDVARHLREAVAQARDPIATLRQIGPLLLHLVTGERAVALNRAAAADAGETGILGATLSRAGREAIAPMLDEVLLQARTAGALAFADTAAPREAFLSLLIGDLQVRRVIGVLPPLSDDDSVRRAETAVQQLLLLFHPAAAPM